MPKLITIEQILITSSHYEYKRLKELEKYLKTDSIKTNGHITIKCQFEGVLHEVRKAIAEIMNIGSTNIYLSYFEK